MTLYLLVDTSIINKDCPKGNIDYWGNDLYPQDDFPSTNTWVECGKMCYDHPNCTYWTWLGNQGVDYEDFSLKCLLKTSNNGQRHWDGAISGDRNCYSQGNSNVVPPYISVLVKYPISINSNK